MKWKYACPHCKAVLNPNIKIILAVRKGKKRGLMLLSPRPGNYKLICDEDLGGQIKRGDAIEFSCPVCHAVLTSPVSSKLSELLLGLPGQPVKKVKFSRIYGEHATFIHDGDSITHYGEDADVYGHLNFFGV
jgi:hypothetical protein